MGSITVLTGNPVIECAQSLSCVFSSDSMASVEDVARPLCLGRCLSCHLPGRCTGENVPLRLFMGQNNFGVTSVCIGTWDIDFDVN